MSYENYNYNEGNLNEENNTFEEVSTFDMQKYVASLSFLPAGNFGNEEAKKAMFEDLAKAQGDLPSIKKDKKGDKSKYATLDNILEGVHPILAKNNLSILQNVYDDGKYIGVQTILTHNSGAEIRSAITIREYEKVLAGKYENKLQNVGAMMTYYKRYSLCSILGICLDNEDNDGASFSPNYNSGYNSGYNQGYNSPPPVQPTPPPAPPTPEIISATDIAKIEDLLGKINMNWDKFKSITKLPPELPIKELTVDNAKKIIAKLEKEYNAAIAKQQQKQNG